MALAKGWARGVEFYGSTNLTNWNHLSTFVVDLPGRPSFQWECPDLIQFGNKWVLLVSVNPGGPIQGSGMMYFVGDFDGKEFKADALDYPLWLDYGMDCYAGVTWSNTGDRKVMIGWMNNWTYAGAVPCSPWRSAMTLPRELKLTEFGGKPLLCCPVVTEIDKIASQWQTVSTEALPLDAQKSAYQLRINVSMDQNTTITLSNAHDEKFVIDIRTSDRMLAVHRNSSTGKTNFNGSFSIPSMQAPLNVEGSTVQVDLYVDQSSIEIITQDGAMSMTNLVFPQSIYDQLTISNANSTAQVRSLSRIW
jgi:fructan beta-fructosidase